MDGAEYSAVLNKVGQAGVDNRSSTNDEEEGEVDDDNESGQPAHADSLQPKKKSICMYVNSGIRLRINLPSTSGSCF